MFHLKPEPLSDRDTAEMDRLLWIWRERYDARLDEKRKTSQKKGVNLFENDQAMLDDWLTFADLHFEAF